MCGDGDTLQTEVHVLGIFCRITEGRSAYAQRRQRVSAGTYGARHPALTKRARDVTKGDAGRGPNEGCLVTHQRISVGKLEPGAASWSRAACKGYDRDSRRNAPATHRVAFRSDRVRRRELIQKNFLLR